VRTGHLVRSRLAAGVTAGLAALLLAGCGGDDDSSTSAGSSGSETSSETSDAGNGESEKTGAEVSEDAIDALEAAGSVHVAGTVTAEGEETTFDIQLQGDDAAGTITLGGQTVELIRTAGTAYMKGDAALWTSFGVPAEAVAQLDGTWVLMPPGTDSGLDTFTFDGFLDEIRDGSGGDGGNAQEEVATEELDGQEVVVVTDDDGSKLYVAATGEPYPLKVVDTGDEPGEVTFSNFGKTESITAPPAPLDLSQFGA